MHRLRLADMLHVSRPGVTSKVNELIRRGLVTKTPDPEDGGGISCR